MTARKTLLLLAAMGVAAALVVGDGVVFARGDVPDCAAPHGRPNIVLVTIDALRADHVSAYGYSRMTTPAIDAFARTAVRFDQAIAQAPYTKASIASLMTGVYPSTHKTVTATVPFGDAMTGRPRTRPLTTDVLPASATTLAEALQGAGYRTFGFTTNPFLLEAFGFAQGFEQFRFFPGGDFASADQVVDAATEAIRAADRLRPVFLWVHLMEPHSPYVPPAWTAGTFKPSGPAEPIARDVPIPDWLLPGTPRDRRAYVSAYDNEIAAADVAVDTLIREFSTLRSSRPSVVVLTSDHGEQFLEHHGWEHSTNLHDELIHVPLIIKAPGVAPGAVSAQVQLVAVYPTLLEYAGADPTPVAGRSLAGVLRRVDGSAPAISEIAGSQYALRDEGWKLIMSPAGTPQLFDLTDDPGELIDVAVAQPDRVRRMRTVLQHEIARALERGRVIRSETAPVDPAVAERLRALGYIR